MLTYQVKNGTDTATFYEPEVALAFEYAQQVADKTQQTVGCEVTEDGRVIKTHPFHPKPKKQYALKSSAARAAKRIHGADWNKSHLVVAKNTAGTIFFNIEEKLDIKFNAFAMGYLIAALWSSTDDAGKELDSRFSIQDIAPEYLLKIVADCNAFEEQAGDMIAPENILRSSDGNYLGSFGHDFWLTRHGHGAGFWDGDYVAEVGEKLSALAKTFKETPLYVADDGLLHY